MKHLRCVCCSYTHIHQSKPKEKTPERLLSPPPRFNIPPRPVAGPSIGKMPVAPDAVPRDREPEGPESEDEDDDDERQAYGNGDDEETSEFPISHELTLKDHNKVASAIALDPSGARIASGSHDYDCKLWDFGGMNAGLKPFKSWEPAGTYYVSRAAHA